MEVWVYYSFVVADSSLAKEVDWNLDNGIHVLLQTCIVTFITTLGMHGWTTMHGCKFALSANKEVTVSLA